MILVTGATGHVGAELLTQLAGRGVPVRAMTRRPEAAAFPDGVEVVRGDCDDPSSLDAAFAGVDRAFLMTAQVNGSTAGPTHTLAQVAAAQRAEVGHLVKLSVGGGGGTTDPLGRWHRAEESAVTDSGIAWTLLRPGRFMSNTLVWATMLHRGDTVHVPFAQRPSTPIDPADIAAVAAVALTGPTLHNQAVELSGPELLTPVDELRIIGSHLGRQLQLVEPPVEQAAQGMIRSGMPPEIVEAIVERVLRGVEGTDIRPEVAQVLGRPATRFDTWVRCHIEKFR